MVLCNRIIFLMIDFHYGAVLLALFYRGCIKSILWAQSTNIFLWGIWSWWSVNHFHRMKLLGIAWSSTMFLSRSKIWLFFIWRKNIFWASSSHVYLDYGILIRYKFKCGTQYLFLSMYVTFWEIQISHNPSIEYWSNVQTPTFWRLHSPLNH